MSENRKQNGATAALKPKGKFDFKSVRFQTWAYFFLLAALVLFVLWLFQVIFYKSSYQAMKKQQVERLGEKIIDKYPGHGGDKEFDGFLRQTAYGNGLNIIVFHAVETCADCDISEVGFKAEYISSQFNADDLTDKGLIAVDDPRIIDGWEDFYVKVKERGECCFSKNSSRGNYLYYGARLSDDRFLYMATPVQAYESSVSVMSNQFLVPSVICFAMSVVVAYFISERITKPIADFSRKARKLGEGDYSVRFCGNGYTEIENLAETLNYATDEIGKTEQLRRDFLANVSHDLRTPLTMVKAYAEMIRDISGSDEVKRNRHSQVIIDEADRLTGLVNDILNLSKLQSGTKTLNEEKLDLGFLVRTVVERFDLYSTRDGYVFEVEESGDCSAIGDHGSIEQVLYNLVGNAISHAGDDKTVRISVRGEESKVRVSVRDNGSGIAPDEIDKVWDRYYRANQTKRTVVGSGLGLSIVKSILVAHGAEYGVESALGEGTEFWFTLERGEEPTAELPPPPAKKSRRKAKNK